MPIPPRIIELESRCLKICREVVPSTDASFGAAVSFGIAVDWEAGAGGDAAIALPQVSQNALPSETCAPHCPQKRALIVNSVVIDRDMLTDMNR